MDEGMSRRNRGRAVLAEVLGEEYLRQRDASTTPFKQPLRELSEAVAFGDVWTRPGLDRKVRSMLCLAMLTALNRPEELRLHVVSAMNNGCTVGEIQEVLFQTVVYCGFPATQQAFRVAEETLKANGLM